MEVKLKFLKRCEIEIIESLDENDDIAYSAEQIFEENECIDCDTVTETEDVYEVQFGDGSIAYIEKQLVSIEKEID